MNPIEQALFTLAPGHHAVLIVESLNYFILVFWH